MWRMPRLLGLLASILPATLNEGHRKEKTMETLEPVLIRRDGMTQEEAREMIEEARERVLENMENPEEILHSEFGLEPDYLFDLIGM